MGASFILQLGDASLEAFILCDMTFILRFGVCFQLSKAGLKALILILESLEFCHWAVRREAKAWTGCCHIRLK